MNDKSLTFSQSSVVSSAGWTCSTGRFPSTDIKSKFHTVGEVYIEVITFHSQSKSKEIDVIVMESSRFPSGNNLRWLNPLDPSVMLAAAAAGSVTHQMGLMDSVSSSSSVSDSPASRFAPLVYQHLFHHLPPPRNQQQNFDFLTYHAAALHQHLAVAAAAASNRTFQQCQQQFSPAAIMNRMPFSAGAPDASFLEGDSRSSKKSATIGYSVADLLSDHQRSNSCDRMNNTSPERSGNFKSISSLS